MGGKMPKQEPASIAANAQAAASQEIAKQKTYADRPAWQGDQYGSQTWKPLANGQWESQYSLSPQQQRIFNRQQATQQGQADVSQAAQKAYANELGFSMPGFQDGSNLPMGGRVVNPYSKNIVAATPSTFGNYGSSAAYKQAYNSANSQGKKLMSAMLAKSGGAAKPLTAAQRKANAAWQVKATAWDKAQALKNKLNPNAVKYDPSQADSLLEGLDAYQKFDPAMLGNMPELGINLGAMPNKNIKLGKMPTADDATRQRVEDALYGRATSRLDPAMQQQERSLNNRLAQMGFMPGSGASSKALQDFGRTRNDAYGNAMKEAIIGGGEEQSRLFDMAMQGRRQQYGEGQGLFERGMEGRKQMYDEGKTAFDRAMEQRNARMGETQAGISSSNLRRQAQLGERMGQRQNRLQEFMSLMGGGQGGQGGGNFAQPASSAAGETPDLVGAAAADSQAAQARYNAEQQKKQQMVGAGVSAAVAAATIAATIA